MKKLILIFLTVLIAQQVSAQQDPQYTQYMYNMNIINPAYAGISEGLSIGALYRSQWVGLDGGPETFTFNTHSPVGKRVGLGLTNIVVEYLEYTERFLFTEDKTEIKNRMVKQFQASQSGITEDKLDGRGKIRLARYFVYVEVYDFSVSEDETIKLKDGVKNTLTTRLGLQVKFVDAETGSYFTASGLGEASTVREMTLLNDDNLSEVKFNQSTIGITTKKALETASARIVRRMISKQIFDH